LGTNEKGSEAMKKTTKITVRYLLELPIVALVFWLIWEHIIITKFPLPELNYGEAFLIIVAASCIFSPGYGLYLSAITDKLYNEDTGKSDKHETS
jgi:hypothetical protein